MKLESRLVSWKIVFVLWDDSYLLMSSCFPFTCHAFKIRNMEPKEVRRWILKYGWKTIHLVENRLLLLIMISEVLWVIYILLWVKLESYNQFHYLKNITLLRQNIFTSNLRKEEIILALSPIMVGKSWQQDLGEAGHIAESGSRRDDVLN